MVDSFDINLFVDHMASPCLCRPASRFWSHLTSIAIEPATSATLEEEGQGAVGLLTSWNVATSRVVQYDFPQLPSTLEESVLL
jgi:hypothetical protein